MSAEKKAVPSLLKVKHDETSYGKEHDLLLHTVVIAYKEQRWRVADIVKNGIARQVDQEHMGEWGDMEAAGRSKNQLEKKWFVDQWGSYY